NRERHQQAGGRPGRLCYAVAKGTVDNIGSAGAERTERIAGNTRDAGRVAGAGSVARGGGVARRGRRASERTGPAASISHPGAQRWGRGRWQRSLAGAVSFERGLEVTTWAGTGV